MDNDIQKKIEKFLEGIRAISEEKYQMIIELRKKVAKINPNVKERMMYGGIMFYLEDDLGGVFAYTNHISFEFGLGYRFKDPDHLLKGKGKFRRHLKIESIHDPGFKKAEFYISQMFKEAE